MLILTRKVGQEIHIDEEIVVSIIKNRGNQVLVGIKAPPEIKIRRAELGKKPKPTFKVIVGEKIFTDN